MNRKASKFKIIDVSFPLSLFVALIQETRHNTDYIRHINRVNYAYADFFPVLIKQNYSSRCLEFGAIFPAKD